MEYKDDKSPRRILFREKVVDYILTTSLTPERSDRKNPLSSGRSTTTARFPNGGICSEKVFIIYKAMQNIEVKIFVRGDSVGKNSGRLF